MIKNINEVTKTLGFKIIIIVVLGLLLYDYVPMAKVVPEPVSYTTPEDVKEELVQAGEVDDNQVIMTYEVNSSDLNNYEKIKNYNPGKANPFSSYQSQTNENGNATDGNTTSTTGSTKDTTNANTNSNTTNNSSSSGGHFFQDKGTK